MVTDPADWRNTDVTVAAGGAVQTTTLVGTPGIYGGQPAGSVPLGSAAVPRTWDISAPTGALGPPPGRTCWF